MVHAVNDLLQSL